MLLRRRPSTSWLLAVLGVVASACAASSSSDAAFDNGGFAGAGGAGGATDGGVCAFGQVVCDGATARTCDGKGTWSSEVDCAAVGKACADTLGCVACVPLSGSCANGVAQVCDASGGSRIEFVCDPVQGMSCDPDGCHGACSPAVLGTSYVGCEYWPTVTANGVWSKWFDFAVAIANGGTVPANVTITRAGAAIATVTVAPGALEIAKLPWVAELKGADADEKGNVVAPTASVLAKGGAYRLRSDHPVGVYQFNPLEYEDPKGAGAGCPDPMGLGQCLSYSNDASLLLPTTALTGNYVVTGYHAWHVASPQVLDMGDFVAITATEDGTVLEIQAPSAVLAGSGLDPLGPGEKGEVKLGQGDVLELFTAGTSSMDSFSGAYVWEKSGKPIQIVSGVPCVNIPDDNSACDHVEESVFPVETLGTDYVVSAPTTPAGVRLHTVRIVAIADGTSLAFDPPTVHKSVTVNRGQVVSVEGVKEDFRVSSAQPFGVTQYMHGQGPTPNDPHPTPPAAGAGDPSQSNAVPTAQFRGSYVFVAPTDYSASYVNVIAPTGSEVTLDGAPLASSDFTAVGASGMSVAREKLDALGVHEIHSDKAFGIVVYGYGQYTSYMYPGGLELKRLGSPPAK